VEQSPAPSPLILCDDIVCCLPALPLQPYACENSGAHRVERMKETLGVIRATGSRSYASGPSAMGQGQSASTRHQVCPTSHGDGGLDKVHIMACASLVSV
jgi:hypothetical protein